MSSWTRHMKVTRSKISTKGSSNSNINGTGSKSNYSSYLPAVYTGLANRIDRYRQYDQMDQDPEINASLNILADFCTQNSEDFDIPFDIKYKDDMGDTEVMMLEDRLESWCDLNKFKIRIHNIFRGALKYGDQFFIRDPETQELFWVNPMNVDKITVNESTGKVPVIYYMRDVSLNLKDKVMSNNHLGFQNGAYPGSLPDTLSGASNMYGSAGGRVIDFGLRGRDQRQRGRGDAALRRHGGHGVIVPAIAIADDEPGVDRQRAAAGIGAVIRLGQRGNGVIALQPADLHRRGGTGGRVIDFGLRGCGQRQRGRGDYQLPGRFGCHQVIADLAGIESAGIADRICPGIAVQPADLRGAR